MKAEVEKIREVRGNKLRNISLKKSGRFSYGGNPRIVYTSQRIKIHKLGYIFSINFQIHTLGYGFVFGNHKDLAKVLRLLVCGFFSLDF